MLLSGGCQDTAQMATLPHLGACEFPVTSKLKSEDIIFPPWLLPFWLHYEGLRETGMFYLSFYSVLLGSSLCPFFFLEGLSYKQILSTSAMFLLFYPWVIKWVNSYPSELWHSLILTGSWDASEHLFVTVQNKSMQQAQGRCLEWVSQFSVPSSLRLHQRIQQATSPWGCSTKCLLQ